MADLQELFFCMHVYHCTPDKFRIQSYATMVRHQEILDAQALVRKANQQKSW